MLVSFAAHAKHCAFYPGAEPLREHKDALKAYSTEKGTVRFDAAKPLPTTLVRKLVKTRATQVSGETKSVKTKGTSTKRKSSRRKSRAAEIVPGVILSLPRA